MTFFHNISKLLLYEVVFLIIFIGSIKAFPKYGLDWRESRVQRNVHCKANQEYPDGNICCENCPAGTHVTSPCTIAGQRGTCQECEDGKYTEHANGLRQCLKCTMCRSDQEMVRHCTTTQDTECQCKPGTFCHPDHACELCMKCSTCKNDEEKVRNCTATTNTQCKKIQLNPDNVTAKDGVLVTVLVIVITAVSASIIGVFVYFKKRRNPDQHDEGKADQNLTKTTTTNGETQRPSWAMVRPKSSAALEDERKMLCESLNSSASNSQHSLTVLPSFALFPTHTSAHLVTPEHLNTREDEQFLKLIPVNGEESLRQCFGYFEEMDVDYHKRFFRNLGISDNVIKSKEHLQYEDKIHELLNSWLEKQGREASLNDLLKALLELNQRRTAETVKENAIHKGHYTYE